MIAIGVLQEHPETAAAVAASGQTLACQALNQSGRVHFWAAVLQRLAMLQGYAVTEKLLLRRLRLRPARGAPEGSVLSRSFNVTYDPSGRAAFRCSSDVQGLGWAMDSWAMRACGYART